MTLALKSCHRHRFPTEIISHAVWLYHVFSLSLRDVVVTQESIRHWCRKFGGAFAERLPTKTAGGGYVAPDEVAIRIGGARHYLWRAVDQHGLVLDARVQENCDGAATKCFLR
jgi:putative transposase